jgi:hypothetical protein
MNNNYLDQSNALITEVLKQVTSAVSDVWDSINLDVKFAEGVVEIKPSFVKEGVKNSMDLDPSVLNGMLNELKDLNSSSEKGELKGLVFQITPDNKFTVDYEY